MHSRTTDLISSVPFDRSDQWMNTHQYIHIYCIIYAEYVRLKRLYFSKVSTVNKQNNDYLHRNVDTRTDTGIQELFNWKMGMATEGKFSY